MTKYSERKPVPLEEAAFDEDEPMAQNRKCRRCDKEPDSDDSALPCTHHVCIDCRPHNFIENQQIQNIYNYYKKRMERNPTANEELSEAILCDCDAQQKYKVKLADAGTIPAEPSPKAQSMLEFHVIREMIGNTRQVVVANILNKNPLPATAEGVEGIQAQWDREAPTYASFMGGNTVLHAYNQAIVDTIEENRLTLLRVIFKGNVFGHAIYVWVHKESRVQSVFDAVWVAVFGHDRPRKEWCMPVPFKTMDGEILVLWKLLEDAPRQSHGDTIIFQEEA